MKFPGKLMSQTLENDKKPNFGLDFNQIWAPKTFFGGFSSTSS